ncbi:hypothetical protein Tco_0693105 [Tanacetum coccineum]
MSSDTNYRILDIITESNGYWISQMLESETKKMHTPLERESVLVGWKKVRIKSSWQSEDSSLDLASKRPLLDQGVIKIKAPKCRFLVLNPTGSTEVLYLGSNMAYSINEYGVFSFQTRYGAFDTVYQSRSPVRRIQLMNAVYSSSELIRKEKMVDEHHPEVQKASTSKGVESPIDDATLNDNENGSSSSSECPNFRGFTNEETKVLNSMIKKQVGKAIKNVMPFYISQTTDNLKEIIQKELAEFKRGGILNDYRTEMATYRDITACDIEGR